MAANLQRSGEHGGARTVVLVLVVFLMGLISAAVFLRRPAQPAVTDQRPIALSPASSAVLAGIEQPVEIRFYSILDANSEARLRGFSERVERLLAAYSQVGAGKVSVIWKTNGEPNAARADGIRGFDLNKGEGCYLGIAFLGAGKKEVLAQLSPGWEPALEADISRALERVGRTDEAAKAPGRLPSEDRAMMEEIQRKIPNLASIPIEEAINLLRQESIKEFTFTVTKLNELVQEATEKLVQAQKQGTAEDQQAALKGLQAAQAAETQMLKEVAANAQLQVDAVKRFKANGEGK